MKVSSLPTDSSWDGLSRLTSTDASLAKASSTAWHNGPRSCTRKSPRQEKSRQHPSPSGLARGSGAAKFCQIPRLALQSCVAATIVAGVVAVVLVAAVGSNSSRRRLLLNSQSHPAQDSKHSNSSVRPGDVASVRLRATAAKVCTAGARAASPEAAAAGVVVGSRSLDFKLLPLKRLRSVVRAWGGTLTHLNVHTHTQSWTTSVSTASLILHSPWPLASEVWIGFSTWSTSCHIPGADRKSDLRHSNPAPFAPKLCLCTPP